VLPNNAFERSVRGRCVRAARAQVHCDARGALQSYTCGRSTRALVLRTPCNSQL
jgi:hypothetical protein